MVALRLTWAARPAVQLRRLLVAAASAGTGFLLLSCFGYALNHPEAADAAALRLAWCAVPLAATTYFALAVARTDPGTRPRTGLSAVGLGPARLMAFSALTTALSCALGSLLALLVFLQLRGDLAGLPYSGAAADVLASGEHLPLPATLTLLAVVPALASATVALALRPKDPRPATPLLRRYGRFGAYGYAVARETFGTYGRFGARSRAGAGAPRGKHGQGDEPAQGDEHGQADAGEQPGPHPAAAREDGEHPGHHPAAADAHGEQPRHQPAVAEAHGEQPGRHPVGAPDDGAQLPPHPAGSRAAAAMGVPPRERNRARGRVGADGSPPAPGGETGPEPPAPDADWTDGTAHAPGTAPAGLPWGIALLATGLAVQAYAGHANAAVLLGWLLTATGLVLAAPGLTHLCGLLLQVTRPGALRLLAGRVLMAEATRIGRPLGVVCAVASAGYAMTTLYRSSAPAFGPLTTLGGLLVTGCTVATLLTAAVESRQCRADTTAALLRLGAPASMLRAAAALRAAALLTLFGPLTLVVAALAALPAGR
ncbi:hypothetical protein FB563_1161 [Streptomyces puniciscabiei]|uniref:Uncharacterized protein n=1 Tax=Streptomyces puniciscabiei TaxID=164348 RepID=A0A542UAW5_9ACTN|nr:hypothetical protein [Streptomyces puniciscabiei]TQK96223.1 hypothetical protein FB563_1161 [Streptomyces puniciscabiei]